MRRVDFENGGIIPNIVQAAFPMLIAQVLNLLYNIVDRIYIARIPEIGTAALGAVGLCFPVIVIITAFSNLFGSGGAPLFAIARGGHEQERARRILHTSFTMLVYCAVVLMAAGLLFARPVLALFGASPAAMQYALPYMTIYLLGTLPAMLTTGPQPVRQRPGLCDHRHDERCDRRGRKPCSGPDFHLCSGHGCRRGGGRDGALPGSFGGVRAVLSVYQSGVPSPSPAAARAGGQLCLPARYPKLGHSRFHHAADQQRRHDLLQ